MDPILKEHPKFRDSLVSGVPSYSKLTPLRSPRGVAYTIGGSGRCWGQQPEIGLRGQFIGTFFARLNHVGTKLRTKAREPEARFPKVLLKYLT